MEYTPWVEKHRNSSLNPRQANGGYTAEGYTRFGTQWSRTFVSGITGHPLGITTANQLSCTTAHSGGSRGFDWYGNPDTAPSASSTWVAQPVSPGQTVSASVWARSNRSVQFNFGVRFFNVNTLQYTSGLLFATPVSPAAGTWGELKLSSVAPAGTTHMVFRGVSVPATFSWNVGDVMHQTGIFIGINDEGPYLDGSQNPNGALSRTRWLGPVDASASVLETRQTIPEIPIRNLSTQEVLYGDRVTTYRWEVLEHSNGIDQLVGILDGVSEGRLTWTQNAAVKGGGKVQVADLDVAEAGKLRIGDLALESVRLRPVCVVQGLPENPLGVFLLSNAKEEWDATGRVWSMDLLDKTTVPDQDQVDQSYAVAAGTPILQRVKTILASAGEFIDVDASSTLATSSGMVWEAGTTKLKIINDLLDVAGYNSLWIDGYGNFQATKRVLPADRSILYEVLGIPRELKDGSQSIYRPDWNRERDSFDVPNKVITVQAADGEDSGAIVGQWTNEDPSSPYSYQSRGRWITRTIDGVECPDGTAADILAFLNNRARTTLIQMSAVQAQVKIEHLPIPIRVSDVVQFAHSKAGVDARHVVTRIELETSPLGMMKSSLQEVVSL